jgi:hypothetical protein
VEGHREDLPVLPRLRPAMAPFFDLVGLLVAVSCGHDRAARGQNGFRMAAGGRSDQALPCWSSSRWSFLPAEGAGRGVGRRRAESVGAITRTGGIEKGQIERGRATEQVGPDATFENLSGRQECLPGRRMLIEAQAWGAPSLIAGDPSRMIHDRTLEYGDTARGATPASMRHQPHSAWTLPSFCSPHPLLDAAWPICRAGGPPLPHPATLSPLCVRVGAARARPSLSRLSPTTEPNKNAFPPSDTATISAIPWPLLDL